MFGISFEHIIILGVILIIVGPRRLPELGNTMGKAIKNFKDSVSGMQEPAFKRVAENTTSPAAVAPAAPVVAAAPVATPSAEPVEKTQA